VVTVTGFGLGVGFYRFNFRVTLEIELVRRTRSLLGKVIIERQERGLSGAVWKKSAKSMPNSIRHSVVILDHRRHVHYFIGFSLSTRVKLSKVEEQPFPWFDLAAAK
jgi:hypothetical protein